MFGIKKLLAPAKVKAVAGSNFVNILSQEKFVPEENIIKKNDTKYDEIFQNALSYFKAFLQSNGENVRYLKATVENLLKAIELKESSPSPYYYLASVFYLSGDNNLALKYMKTVQFLDPDFPELDLLRQDITNSSLMSNQINNPSVSDKPAGLKTIKRIQRINT